MGCRESKHAVATRDTLSRKSSRAGSKRETKDKNNSMNNNVNNNDNVSSGLQQSGNSSDAKGKTEKAMVQEQNKALEKSKEAEETTGEIVSEGQLTRKSQGGEGEKLKEADKVNVATVAQEQAPEVENKAENELEENKASEERNEGDDDVGEKAGEIVNEKELLEKSEAEEKKPENETQNLLEENDAAVAEEKDLPQEITVVNDTTVAEEKASTEENKAENEQGNALEVNVAATEDSEPPQERKEENENENVNVNEENVEKVEDTANTEVSTSEGENDLKAEEVKSENPPSSINDARTE